VPQPAVATVVVTYQSAPAIEETLRAVSDQMRDGDELVVVDNASADGSAALARSLLAPAQVVELEENAGFAAACHVGADATRAPLLFFLNPDSRLEPGCLDALRAAAAEHPGWGAWQALVLLGGGERVNTSGGVTHWLGFGWAGDCDRALADVALEPREVSFASGAALVVRRGAWETLGGFAPRYFMYGEDLDLSLRLRLAGWGVGVVPAARVEHDYGFAKGDYKWFFLERNRWWTVLATYPRALLVLLAPALLAFEVALLAVAARDGWLRPKLRAQAAVLRSLPWALERRRATQALRRASPPAFAAGLTASLDSPYLSGAARVRALDRAQAGYWALVTANLRRLHG
jgi:N-acetylglucosaminyl-diphospho-decaprenol L-rhamnosyltransferase